MSSQVRLQVQRNTVVRVFVKDPEDISLLEVDPNRLLSNAQTGATASYPLFDDELEMVLRGTADGVGACKPAGSAARRLEVGDRLWLLEDDKTEFNSDVTAVDLDAGTVTVTGALAGKATKGKQVRRALLASRTALLEFGTPAQGDKTWGFAIGSNPDALGLLPQAFHRWSIEIFFKGAAASDDLNFTEFLLGQFDDVVEA